MFAALKKHCRANVLDVGGWDFVYTIGRGLDWYKYVRR